MKAFWTYTIARLAVFAVAYAILWLATSFWIERTALTNLLVLLAALLLSSGVSIFLLAGLRDRLARNVQERAARITERIEESRRAEDID